MKESSSERSNSILTATIIPGMITRLTFTVRIALTEIIPAIRIPHIWLGPSALKTQAETVLKTLVKLDPSHEEFFRRNYETLIPEIDTTRDEIAALLKPYENGTVFVFHPAYGYFCDEFHLKQRAIEFEGKSPTASQLAELVSETKNEKSPPSIFVQPEFNRAPADAIAEATGGRILVHSPLDRDLLANLKKLAEMIGSKEGFRSKISYPSNR